MKIDTSKFELSFVQSESVQYLFLLVCSYFLCGMEAKCKNKKKVDSPVANLSIFHATSWKIGTFYENFRL